MTFVGAADRALPRALFTGLGAPLLLAVAPGALRAEPSLSEIAAQIAS